MRPHRSARKGLLEYRAPLLSSRILDSVSQIVLGASVAGLCAPAGQRRKALLLGAGLGTLPDLDVFIDYGDPVSDFTYHRSVSHSLFVLLPFSVVLWLILRRWWTPVQAAPWHWLAAIVLALVTHPLLDGHTVYGTQLLWPMTTPPVMWATVFIIDPAYTLPLLCGVAFAAATRKRKAGSIALALGLVISSSYIGWSWIAKSLVEGEVVAALQPLGLRDAPRFSVPTPFNSLLWRVVVRTHDGYLEGYRSLVADEGPMSFTAYPSDNDSLQAASDIWAVARLRWFTHDFLKAQVRNDKLILSDLRMGVEPSYSFVHSVAARGDPHWHSIPPERITVTIEPKALLNLWHRIWTQ